MSDDLLTAAARLRCRREHDLAPGQPPCDECRLAAASELAEREAGAVT